MDNNRKERMRDRYKLSTRTLSQIRTESGWTLADVAKETGYSVPTICRFEHGETDSGVLFAYYIDTWIDGMLDEWRDKE